MVRSATIENYSPEGGARTIENDSDGPLRTIPGLSEWTIENYSGFIRMDH